MVHIIEFFQKSLLLHNTVKKMKHNILLLNFSTAVAPSNDTTETFLQKIFRNNFGSMNNKDYPTLFFFKFDDSFWLKI